LLQKEITCTAFQFPFALSIDECLRNPNGNKWTAVLLESIGELASVAGGHARSFFEMSPRSIILRVTPSLVAGFNTYGFDETGDFKELTRINKNDLPGKEFWIGGELVRNLSDVERTRLLAEGCHLFDNPQQCLKAIGDEALTAGVR